MEWYHGNNDTTVKVINHGHTQIPWYYWSYHGKKEKQFRLPVTVVNFTPKKISVTGNRDFSSPQKSSVTGNRDFYHGRPLVALFIKLNYRSPPLITYTPMLDFM